MKSGKEINPITISELILYLGQCGRRINMPRTKEETLLAVQVASLLKCLTLEGKINVVWFHVANEGIYTKYSNPLYGAILKSMGKLNGIPDFVLISPKSNGFIELKSKKGRISKDQDMFRRWCRRESIPYEVVNDISQIEPLLKEWGMMVSNG